MELSGVSSVVPPPPVRAGDRVAVAALSGPVDGEALDRGLDALRELGFEPVVAPNLRRRHGLFAGTDRERLAGFHQVAADPAVRAVFFARGGHGVLRLLPHIDWALLSRQPRAYIGYSDLTPFLLEVIERLGIAAFHGPMVSVELAAGLDEAESESLLAMLEGRCRAEIPVEPLAPRGAGGADRVVFEPGAFLPGVSDRPAPRVEGRLLGGCLSLLTATLGTAFAPRLAESLFFWEDIAEPLYRLDRMLNQLRLSGSLEGVRAMVVGRVDPLVDEDSEASLADHLSDLAREFEWPVVVSCPSGHCRPNLTLPLGLNARLEPEAGRLIVGAP